MGKQYFSGDYIKDCKERAHFTALSVAKRLGTKRVSEEDIEFTNETQVDVRDFTETYRLVFDTVFERLTQPPA